MGGHITHTRARAGPGRGPRAVGRGPWALGLGPWYLGMRFAGVAWVLLKSLLRESVLITYPLD